MIVATTASSQVTRDSLKEHQDDEFEASLRADRARKEMEQRQLEDAKKRETDAQEQADLDRAIGMSLEQERRNLATSIPAEPAKDEPGCITLLFRCGATSLRRRFPAQTAFRVILAYLQLQECLKNMKWEVRGAACLHAREHCGS